MTNGFRLFISILLTIFVLITIFILISNSDNDKETLTPRQAQLLLRERIDDLKQKDIQIEGTYINSDENELIIVLRQKDKNSMNELKKILGKKTKYKVIEGHVNLDKNIGI